MTYRIAYIAGDGIGPEIGRAALQVLKAVENRTGMKLEVLEVEGGDTCLQRTGKALPDASIEKIKSSHACLKGPVGDTAADVIVRLRRILDLYANIRPAKCLPRVNCLRPDIDFVIVRENTEDVYQGMEFTLGDTAVALRVISKRASTRIAEHAFKLALTRRKRVVAVHKKNVLRVTDSLFANACKEVASRYRDVEFSEMLVDAAAMNLIRQPQTFDVIVTPNMFGDILSDEAAQLVGGLGLAYSANLGDEFAIFEPVHGSAPDIAGRDIANPISMILTVRMMLEWLSSKHNDEKCKAAANEILRAVEEVLKEGTVTSDLNGSHTTQEVGRAIASKVEHIT